MAKKHTSVIDEKDKKGLDPTPDSNPDPITKEPGAHPVGVAAGGAGGGAAGAAIGAAIGGPVGAVVGGAIGAIAGGLAGKGAAEVVNPTEENRYWQENYKSRPYYKKGDKFDKYEPAYRYGWERAARLENRDRRFEDVESELEAEWPQYHTSPESNWSEYREPAQDAYNRVQSRYREGADTDKRDLSDSVWQQTEGNWRQFKGFVKEKWNKLTDDEIEAMEGRRDRIVGKIQERYGEAKWDANKIESEFSNYRSSDKYNKHFDSDRGKDLSDSVWKQTEGNWHQFKGFIKEKWNLLTDDEIEAMQGRRERIIGKIQERYGEQNWDDARIESEFRTYCSRK